MSVEADLERLAAAVADAAGVAPGDVVVLVGDEDTGPAAVSLAAEVGRRGAVARPWLSLAAVRRGHEPADDPLLVAVAGEADVVIGLNVAPPSTATARVVQVAVPTHLTAQDAGRSLAEHAAALADAPELVVGEPRG
jgi:hypothetical protein